MEEEIKKDPRDLNEDGKVSLDEKLKYAASKAGEKISETAASVKCGAKKLYDKAAPKAKELYAEVKKGKGQAGQPQAQKRRSRPRGSARGHPRGQG